MVLISVMSSARLLRCLVPGVVSEAVLSAGVVSSFGVRGRSSVPLGESEPTVADKAAGANNDWSDSPIARPRPTELRTTLLLAIADLAN